MSTRQLIWSALATLLCVGITSAGSVEPILPDWIEENRVQAHSEHGLPHALALTADGHAKAIRSMGADVLTRIYLTRGEGAWWQSKVGEINALIGEREYATEISDAVHAEGMKVIAYFRHMSDDLMQRVHPEWVCKHPDGSPALEPRGKTTTVFILCMNSPYRDYIKTRVVELAQRGVDGIYFDSFHMPDVCVCRYCQAAFKKERGHAIDTSAGVGSPGHLEAVDFVNETMVETFTDWRAAVDAVAPQVMFVIKSSRYPMFESPHIDTRLLAISQTSGTEFHKPFGGNGRVMRNEKDFDLPPFDDQVALGWSLVRDGAGGRPPHMWVPHIRSEQTALYSVAAALNYGCVANVNATIRNLVSHPEHNRELYTSSFERGKRLSPQLAHTRPLALAALHVSPRARNARLSDTKQMWREVFSPALGAFQALREENIPCVTLADDALARGPAPETKLLVLPWPDELTEQEKSAVRRFEKSDAAVLRLDPKAGWHAKQTKPDLIANLRKQLQARSWPITIEGPEAMHCSLFREPKSGRLVVALTNTWGWFRSTKDPNPDLNEGTPPPPCRGVSITLADDFAKSGSILEAVSGQKLKAQKSDGKTRVSVPDFQINACVVVK